MERRGSKGGKPIIALSSTAKNGTVSRIVPMLSPGAGVVTSRGLVRYVVTEYGVAYLHGKSIRERAKGADCRSRIPNSGKNYTNIAKDQVVAASVKKRDLQSRGELWRGRRGARLRSMRKNVRAAGFVLSPVHRTVSNSPRRS